MIFMLPRECPRSRRMRSKSKKKRHVGNDYVSIIWSDHDMHYLPETIRSDFNFVHIVIYPLNSGLFRISIYKKEKANLLDFGPLQDGMVVPFSILPGLVRTTALNADRTVRLRSLGKLPQVKTLHPHSTRRTYIDDIRKKNQIISNLPSD